MLRSVITCQSPEATAALASGVASVVRPGDCLLLSGGLGAGQTTFVRALAEACGVEPGLVSSPTYVLINLYPIPDTSPLSVLRGARLAHVDAYRLTSTDDLDVLGWDQLVDGARTRPETVLIIEWPERLEGATPTDAGTLTFAHCGRNERTITLALPDSWRERPGVPALLSRQPARCPTTGVWVAPTCATHPFSSERARQADLYKWMSGQYAVPVKEQEREEPNA